MKTAKEWSEVYYDLQSKSATEFEIEKAQDTIIRQIQLDAMKSGMLRSAYLCHNSIQSQGPYFDTLIKSRANCLTEGSLDESQGEVETPRKESEKIHLLKNEIKRAYLEGRDDQVNVGIYRNLRGWEKSRARQIVEGNV